ncbi:MAG: hypothetical protein J6K48_10090 [Lachnospiraceae bacterium]|nr:hypothetical protein [Lachnospiraceae bacterium]
MDFEKFAKEAKELIEKSLGESCKVSIHKTFKNNGIEKTGILLKKEGERFCPVLYLEEAYGKFCDGMDLDEAVYDLFQVYRRRDGDAELAEKFSPKFFEDYSYVKEHLQLRLINYEKNTEILKDMPYVRWNDMAAIFFYEIEGWENGQAGVVVNNHHLALWMETVDTLYKDALENMKNRVEEDLFLLKDLFMEKQTPSMAEQPPVYVLTNRTRQYGAAVMLYSGKMKELANTVSSDLVILPSSLHEVLLLLDNDGMHYRWEQMVKEVNRAVVDPEEVLSDHIYRYSREKDAVELLAAG